VKVLILHQHFKSPARGGAIRSYYLGKALQQKGIEVSIITAHNDPGIKYEMIEGIAVHYLPVSYENRFGFIRRSVSFMRYIFGVVRLAPKFRDVSVCYAISVPLTIGMAAIWIKKRFNIPFIFEVGDLWPEAPIQMGVIRNGMFKRFLFALERYIYRQARSIVALSPSIQEAIAQKVPGKKIDLIPNMSDTDFFFPTERTVTTDAPYETQGKFVVSYLGAVGLANGLEYFLACARVSQAQNLPIKFILCGDGARLSYLKDLAAQFKLDNLMFLPFRNREGIRALLATTDAVFVSYKHIPVLETGSPNKYFDGLAAGKLIVINFGGWIKNEITHHTCGVYVDPTRPGNFVEQITPYLNDQALLKKSQQAGRLLAESSYARTILSEKFYQLFV